MDKLLIRGDRLITALRCLRLLAESAQNDPDAFEALTTGPGAVTTDRFASLLDHPYGYSLERIVRSLKERGLLESEDQVTVLRGLLMGLGAPVYLQAFVEANIGALASVELDLSANLADLRDDDEECVWLYAFYRAFASGEITEEMLKEPEPAALTRDPLLRSV